MKINIDLKELWKKQPAATPDSSELFGKADKYKRKNMRELIITNVLLILTSIFIGCIWYFYKPELITTKIGITVVIIGMVSYLVVYNQMIPLLLKTDYSLNSRDYLQQLLKIKEKMRFLQSTMMNLYFILLVSGMFLYMYEYASRMSLIAGVITYAVTAIWFGIAWFILRKRKIKKQTIAINNLIEKFSEINKQFS